MDFLEKKVISVRNRIKEGTGIDVTPIYYSAGYKEEGMPQSKPYNLSKLLYYIVKFTPKKKRLALVENINQDQEMWKDNEELADYRRGIVGEVLDSINDGLVLGADIGGQLGSVFGTGGKIVGSIAGGVIGAAIGGLAGIAGGFFSGVGSLLGCLFG